MADQVDNEPNQKGPLAWLAYLGFRAVLGFFALLPLPVSAWIAGELSALGIRLFAWNRMKEARGFMEQRYGTDRARQIVRANLRHYGILVAEIAHRETLKREVAARYTFRGEENFLRARAKGGVLAVQGHISNWEVKAIGHVARYGGLTVPVKRVHNYYVNRWIEQHRIFTGVTALADRGTKEKLIADLLSGKPITFLADQNTMDTDAVWVPLLGRTAATRVGPTALAFRGKAVVITFMARRIKPGFFELSYGPEIELPDESFGTFKERLYEGTRRINLALDGLIDSAPEQWLWLHRRWKRQAPADVEPWRIGQKEMI